jgi:hypothetical protein
MLLALARISMHINMNTRYDLSNRDEVAHYRKQDGIPPKSYRARYE